MHDALDARPLLSPSHLERQVHHAGGGDGQGEVVGGAWGEPPHAQVAPLGIGVVHGSGLPRPARVLHAPGQQLYTCGEQAGEKEGTAASRTHGWLAWKATTGLALGSIAKVRPVATPAEKARLPR